MSTSEETRQLYAALVIVIIVAAASIVTLILLQGLTETPPVETETPLVDLEGSNGTSNTLTVEGLLSMTTIERFGSYENSFNNTRGNGIYIGVKIADIIDLVYGMGPDDIVIVDSYDGYSQTFTFDNVYPNETQYDIQGDFVLAYSFNGTAIPEYAEGPRLMFLPEDGMFSNIDASLVIDPDYYYGAARPKLVSNVTAISVSTRPASIPAVSSGGTTVLIHWALLDAVMVRSLNYCI